MGQSRFSTKGVYRRYWRQPRKKRFSFSNTLTHYSLSSDGGSYSISGTAATPKYGRLVVASSGTYSISGTNASFLRTYKVQADSGSFAVSGTDVTFDSTYVLSAGGGSHTISGTAASLKYNRLITSSSGSYSVSGTDVTFDSTYTLTATGGSYSISGTDATFDSTYVLACGSGAYSVSGAAANLEYGRILGASGGSYSISGTDAGLENGFGIVAASGSYSISGTAATFPRTYKLAATAGAISLSGTDAGLTYGGLNDYSLSCVSGSYSIAGTDAGLMYGRIMSISIGSPATADLRVTRLVGSGSGTFNINGSDATLLGSVNYDIDANSGTYSITGATAGVRKNSLVGSGSGAFSISGTAATLKCGYKVSSAAGSYVINGDDAGLLYNPVGAYSVSAEAGDFNISGTNMNPEYGRLVSAGSGSYSITGASASLLKGSGVPSAGGSYSISGSASSLLIGKMIAAASGSYSLAGTVSSLERGQLLAASGGSHSISGASASLNFGKTLILSGGAYSLGGQNVSALHHKRVSAAISSYIINGSSVTLSASAQNEYAALVVTTQPAFLKGFWRLNEGVSATIAVDSSPAGQDSVALNGLSFGNPSLLGGDDTNDCALFPGTASGYIQLENNINSGPLKASQFTITGWFKMPTGTFGSATSTGTGGISAIPLVTKGRSEADTVGFNVNYFMGISTNKLAGDFESSGGTNHPITGGTTLVVNRWYFGAITYDGANFRLYLNGVSDASPIATSDAPDITTAQPACIGSAMTTAAIAAGGFNGYIDEVAIWNTALTSGEILTLWEIGRVTKALSGSCSGVSGVSGGVLLSSGLIDIENFNLSSNRVGNFGLVHSTNKTFNLRK